MMREQRPKKVWRIFFYMIATRINNECIIATRNVLHMIEFDRE